MNENLEYKIFRSVEGDWFVAAKRSEPEPKVLYEGHHLELAYESILNDLGIKVPHEERQGMEELGTYIPTREDFSK